MKEDLAGGFKLGKKRRGVESWKEGGGPACDNGRFIVWALRPSLVFIMFKTSALSFFKPPIIYSSVWSLIDMNGDAGFALNYSPLSRRTIYTCKCLDKTKLALLLFLLRFPLIFCSKIHGSQGRLCVK